MDLPCNDCGHGLLRHNGGPEGMCLDCTCPGWNGPTPPTAPARDNGTVVLAWGLAGLIFAIGVLCGWLFLPRVW